MERDIIFAGNWKMNKVIKEALDLVNGLKRELLDIEGCKIVIAPPYTALTCINDVLLDTDIALSAQNMFGEDSGAYTGEISPAMLKDTGCEYAIIGHSERRKYFKENEEIINSKIKLALANELRAIFCIGETLSEREENKTMDIIQTQLLGGLKDISSQDMSNVIVAYEPVWAIGTGMNATPAQAEEVHAFIRGKLTELYGVETAESTTILYGGSVKSENIEELMSEIDIDGALVGGASLTIAHFSEIVKKGLNTKLQRR
ncbi:MAG: triose-phosphate isomerase [Candidatus Saelkia tenebricola]|nr:triose-phosphate isomerase [Candidatus Saelkia tenebricola]